MKRTSCVIPNWSIVFRVSMLSLAMFAGSAALGQNYVRNPDFEEPLGPDNWTVGYAAVTGVAQAPTNCGPCDFMIAGRTMMANKDMVLGSWDGDPYYWNKFGGHFAPNHNGMMHGYFRQVVTGLVANASYVVSSWMAMYMNNANYESKMTMWLEAIGGPDGTISKVTPDVTGNAYNNPYGWQKYSVTNTASFLNPRIEIRLHFNKNDTTPYWEWRNFNAFFDHVSLIRYNQTPTQPPFQMVSLVRSNQDISLAWQSVMNNKYRIQWSPSLNPAVWSWVQWSPWLDTHLYATGPTLSFKTNLASLFSYDSSFDPNVPRYFRVAGWPFEP